VRIPIRSLFRTAHVFFVTVTLLAYPSIGFLQEFPKPSERTEKVQRMAPEELKKLIETKADLHIADVRPGSAYQREHIPGALSFPWNQVIGEPKPLKPGKLLILYCDCQQDVAAADLAIQLVQEWGFKEEKIRALKGGWVRWKELGYPTVRGKRSSSSQASAGPPIRGERFPEISLPIPKRPEERRYLGLPAQRSFKIPQIKASIVIIEVTSLYCPICQKEASKVNQLYEIIERNRTWKDKIKLIGIGAGNSPKEMELLKKTYTIPFPLFDDHDFTLHRALGEVRTPYFIAIKINRDGTDKVIYSEPGAFEEPETFIERITKDSGLNQEQG
jgi:rhodanese-related sulfurtransferase